MNKIAFQKPFEPQSVNRSITKLSCLLNLPRTVSDDWAIDAADPARIAEFCACYGTKSLTACDKWVLMQVMVASLDDCHDCCAPPDPALNAHVEQLLRQDFPLHRDTIEAWCRFDAACGSFFSDDAVDDGEEHGWDFHVSPLMRRVWTHHHQRTFLSRFRHPKTW